MQKRNIKDLGPNECIHCPTEESANIIFSFFLSYGFTRSDKNKTKILEKDTMREWNKSKTAYRINNGEISFDDYPYYVDMGYTIYPRTDFVDDEEKQSFKEDGLYVGDKKIATLDELKKYNEEGYVYVDGMRTKKDETIPVGHIDGDRFWNGTKRCNVDITGVYKSIRPGPFRTGDEVEVMIEGNYSNVKFLGYTTDGLLIFDLPDYVNNVYTLDDCRHQLKKHQHTISCTDEVWEKVKEIDGVDFISDDSQGKSE